MTMNHLFGLAACVATLWATPVVHAQLPSTTPIGAPIAKPAAPAPDAAPGVPGAAPAGAAPATPEDLQKQVDDALKEIEKLDKVVPDDAREEMRQRILRGGGGNIVINGNGRVIINGRVFGPNGPIGPQPGFNPGLNAAVAMGIFVSRPTPILIEQLKLPPNQGQVINEVRAESVATKAGLQKYDILMELNGAPVSSEPALFSKELRDLKPGTEFVASVIRRGQKETIKGFKLPEAGFLPVQPALQPGFPMPNLQVNGGRAHRIQAFNNGDETIVVQATDDAFKIDYTQGDFKATVVGKLENGLPTMSEATIRAGDTTTTARNMSEVPAQHRATIARILNKVK